MSLPAMTSRASRRPSFSNARSATSAPLRGVSLASSSTSGRIAEAVPLAEARAVRGRIELAQVDRVGQDGDPIVGNTERLELLPFGFADGQHTGGSLEVSAPGRRVEDLLGEEPALDERRRAVRRDDVGNPAPSSRMRAAAATGRLRQACRCATSMSPAQRRAACG